ncbi:MAG: inorganic pyrophosphatase [Ignavibacteriae bacterium HGW-Ignavibacteriae-2]|jgi:inorganic pyrophosphatase|nr:inorganic pyrophosphatase [Bacteroidota bacterium]PKL88115.1 MAG: inorganic pyrophosphatase [Ignavibacteriae bacterium HGW-Ignavibacteriae-2]PKN97272.1 MAG: inorganic pyrophosphatase [Chloroflexi bacterium HGW-Chloroflexi-5]
MPNFPKPFYRWRPHPWHGLESGERSPEVVNAFIEITPFDSVKYEVDKTTGYVRVDRPQRTSAYPPTLYGFIPRTYCGAKVAALSPKSIDGDHDPLDICVISERPINRGEIILQARVVGGLQMVDDKRADDKIIAVLEKDNIWGEAQKLSDIPPIMVERLSHYFSTYKYIFGEEFLRTIEKVYDRDYALEVVKAAEADYRDQFGE